MNKGLTIAGTIATTALVAAGVILLQEADPMDTLVVYDQSGQEQMVVMNPTPATTVPDGWVAVKLSRKSYNSYHSKEERERTLVNDVTKANVNVGSALQANINAEDAAVAAQAAMVAAEAAADAASPSLDTP